MFEWDRLKRISEWENHGSKSHLITLAEMYAHAGLANAIYGDYVSGFRKLLKANNLSKKNMEEYPDYWPKSNYAVS